MSGPGATPDEMPGFPFPDRLAPELGEPLLDTVLNGQPLPPDAPEQLHAVADMLASLVGPAAPGELAGEAAARRAFARAVSPAAGRSPARSRLSGLSSRITARVAAALIAAAAGLGGVAGAYAGVLPGPVQDFAHHTMGAPAAHHKPDHPPAGHGAAGRLCTSFEHGSAPARAVASRDLAKAAGEPGRIDAYCAAARQSGLPAAAHPDGHPQARHLKPATHSNYSARHGKHGGGKHGGGKPANGNRNGNGNGIRHNAKHPNGRRGNPRHGKPGNARPGPPLILASHSTASPPDNLSRGSSSSSRPGRRGGGKPRRHIRGAPQPFNALHRSGTSARTGRPGPARQRCTAFPSGWVLPGG